MNHPAACIRQKLGTSAMAYLTEMCLCCITDTSGPRRTSAGRARGGDRMDSLVIEGCAVATVDGTAGGVITAAGTGTEYGPGHLVLQDGRITAVGAGPAPGVESARVVDGRGCLATPGLVGTHHHLFQGLTRGLAQDGSLVRWLTELYPQWARLDPELHAAA